MRSFSIILVSHYCECWRVGAGLHFVLVRAYTSAQEYVSEHFITRLLDINTHFVLFSIRYSPHTRREEYCTLFDRTKARRTTRALTCRLLVPRRNVEGLVRRTTLLNTHATRKRHVELNRLRRARVGLTRICYATVGREKAQRVQRLAPTHAGSVVVQATILAVARSDHK